MRTWILAVAGWAAVASSSAVAASHRAYVLDRDAPSLTALDVPAGGVLARAPLTGQPVHVMPSPDGSRLVVFDLGPGKDKGESGYQATGRASATVVESAGLRVLGRVELGFGLLGGERPLAVWSPDGRTITVVSPGFLGKKAAEALPSELFVIDVGTAALAGRLPLDRPPSGMVSLRGGAGVAVFLPLRAPKAAPLQEAELLFVDPARAALAGRLALRGDPDPPVAAADQGLLYALGSEMVQVVSPETRTVVAALETGGAPRGLVADPAGGRIFVAGDGAGAEGRQAAYGELRVFEGREERARVEVAPEPVLLRFSPRRDRLYVVGRAAITSIDLATLRAQPIHLEKAGWSVGVAGKAGAATEMAMTADGRRAFVLYQSSSKLLLLDLETQEAVAAVTTGRSGVRFLKVLAAVAETAASARSSPTPGVFQVYNVAAARTALAIGPGGRDVYVLNSQTGDVTVVETAGGQVVAKLGGGGHALRLLPGGKLLAVLAPGALRLISTESRQKAAEVPLDDLVDVQDAGADTVAALGESAVVFLDAHTGRSRGGASGFRKAVQLLVVAGAANGGS